MRFGRDLHGMFRFPMRAEPVEIILPRVGNRVWTDVAFARREARLHREPRARLLLCLREAQHALAVRVLRVVRDAERLFRVLAAADEVARTPRASARPLAVAEMAAVVDQSVVGLVTLREAGARRTRFQICIANCARHRFMLPRSCPLFEPSLYLNRSVAWLANQSRILKRVTVDCTDAIEDGVFFGERLCTYRTKPFLCAATCGFDLPANHWAATLVINEHL